MGEGSPAALARELGLFPKLLYNWQDQLRRGEKMNVRGGPSEEGRDRAGGEAGANRRVGATGGKQQLELSFFRGALQRRSIEPAGERPWRKAIFAEIRQVIDPVQGQFISNPFARRAIASERLLSSSFRVSLGCLTPGRRFGHVDTDPTFYAKILLHGPISVLVMRARLIHRPWPLTRTNDASARAMRPLPSGYGWIWVNR